MNLATQESQDLTNITKISSDPVGSILELAGRFKELSLKVESLEEALKEKEEEAYVPIWYSVTEFARGILGYTRNEAFRKILDSGRVPEEYIRPITSSKVMIEERAVLYVKPSNTLKGDAEKLKPYNDIYRRVQGQYLKENEAA